MKKYFDKARDRLVFIEQVADGIYWDNHWEADNQEFARKLKNTNNRFVLARPNFIFREQKYFKVAAARTPLFILFTTMASS